MAQNEDREGRQKEYALPPGMYVQVQDGTNGRIKTHVGPALVNLQGSDRPIVFDFQKGGAKFRTVPNLADALRDNVVVPDGFYAVLVNPARDGKHPQDGEMKMAPELDTGRKVIIQGPAMFALWPGQSAKVVRGHNLKSNEYLVARVYNERDAKENWGKTKMVKATMTEGTDGTAGSTLVPTETPPSARVEPQDLTVGKLLIIKGTEFSFFIPPTGITVMLDKDEDGVEIPNKYVYDAVTLEQLQYCILLDQNGKKRYVKGPAVVFPESTEEFVKDREGNLIFKAIELNELQGIHVKITRDYNDPVLKEMKEGQEIFITGKDYPIYFPREENAIVRYDGKTKVFAVAVPDGEARYVMDRLTGKISLEKGPQMLLPNPVTHVIVRRPLSEQQCDRWYPGNAEVKEWNKALRELAKASPTTRAGAVSEGEIQRGAGRKGLVGATMSRFGRSGVMDDGGSAGMEALNANYVAAMPVAAAALMDSSSLSNDGRRAMADEISRGSNFTQPRTIMLGNKFEGVPKINVWTGFAVLVVNSRGERRVEQGPTNILLKYDEELESLSLSTGKPKTTDKLIFTPYLRVLNNKVADVIQVETGDQVLVDLKVSYHVNFQGDPLRWWNVENYIKFLCDHMRSLLKARAKEIGIEELHANPLPIVRKVVLGEEERGTIFEQNGMVVSDVEVLATIISDAQVAGLLKKSQQAAVERIITLADLTRNLDATKRKEEIKREEMATSSETDTRRRMLTTKAVTEELALELVKIASAIDQVVRKQDLRKAEDVLVLIGHENELSRMKMTVDQEIEQREAELKLTIAQMVADADATVKRFSALQGGLSEALLAISSQRTMVDIAGALSAQKLFGGQNVTDVLGKMFEGTGFAALMEKMSERAAVLPNGNGGKTKAIEGSTGA